MFLIQTVKSNNLNERFRELIQFHIEIKFIFNVFNKFQFDKQLLVTILITAEMLLLGFFIGGDKLTSVKMLFSYNNNEKVVEVPVIPDELPDIIQDLQNESFTTNTSTLTLLGNKKPRSFSLDLFLPTKEYSFAKSTGTEVLNLLGYVASKKIPMRVVVTDGLNELLNIAVSISSFKYHFDTVENIRCSVGFVEYVFLTDNVADNGKVVEFSTVTAHIGNSTIALSAVNKDGYNLIRARNVLEVLGIEVGWNAERKRVTADGKLLDIHTEIYNGNAYCYVRDLAKETGHSIEYNSVDKSITIS